MEAATFKSLADAIRLEVEFARSRKGTRSNPLKTRRGWYSRHGYLIA